MEKKLIQLGIKLERYRNFLVSNRISLGILTLPDGSNPSREIAEIYLNEFTKYFNEYFEGFEEYVDYEIIKKRVDKIREANEIKKKNYNKLFGFSENIDEKV